MSSAGFLGLGFTAALLAWGVSQAGFQAGFPSVTEAVWLDAGPRCGTGAGLGGALAAGVVMATISLLRLIRRDVQFRGDWPALLAGIGAVAAFHVAVMLSDDLARQAGSVALGRALRVFVLALLTGASIVSGRRAARDGDSVLRPMTRLLDCAPWMAALMLTATTPWPLMALGMMLSDLRDLPRFEPVLRVFPAAAGLAGMVAVVLAG